MITLGHTRTIALSLALWSPLATPLSAQDRASRAALPELHHVGLNSADPDKAIEWYLRLWPTARKTTVAGQSGVQAQMLLLFARTSAPPPGAWRDDLHRAVPQSVFWHIGAYTNTTNIDQRLKTLGVANLPLFYSPEDTISTWRSGLVPYTGNHTRAELASVEMVDQRDGGFSYVVAPDGVLFELSGGPQTADSLAHIHLYHEQPLCAANWYVEHLGMELPPIREGTGPTATERPRPRWDPCAVPDAEATWPSLEQIGTIRQPAGGVHFANGAINWYPRQCVGDRCGKDQPLVPSRGQPLDHIAFTVASFDSLYAALRQSGVKILQPPYPFGTSRAFMIEDPDGLAIELIQRK